MRVFVALSLALLVASCHAATLQWRWDTDWMNPANWKGGMLPRAGQTVTFPQSFSSFGSESCSSIEDCSMGSVVSVRPAVGQTVANIQMKSFVLPRGRTQFNGAALIQFLNGNVTSSTETALWDDHGPTGNVFTCANNWVVPGTTANPSFAIPCATDTVMFPDGHTFQLTVPQNVFARNVLYPNSSASNFAEDSAQYTGFPIGTDQTQCVRPFGADKGTAFCSAYCVNSCPELNPDTKAQTRAEISVLQVEAPFIEDAIEAAIADFALEATNVTVRGAVSFVLGQVLSQTVMTTLLDRMKTTLPIQTPFTIALDCASSPSRAIVQCSAVATIQASKVSAVSSSTSDPYTFNSGFILSLYTNAVSTWVLELTSTEAAQQVSDFIGSEWFTVSIVVNNRFINAMGNDLFTDRTRRYLAGVLGLPAQNLGPISAIKSDQPDYSTMSFSVSPTATVDYSSIIDAMIAINTVITFPTAAGALIPLFLESDGTAPLPTELNIAKTSIINAELAHSLPLSDADYIALQQQITDYIQAKTTFGSSVLDVSIQASNFARRDLTDEVVLIEMIIPKSSSLAIVLSESVFDGWVYGSTTSAGLDYSLQSIEALQLASLEVTQAQAYATAASAALSATAILQDLLYYAAPTPSNVATGVYSWTDIGIVADTSSLPALTNKQCDVFNAFNNDNYEFQDALQAEIQKTIPVTPQGIDVNGNITCKPLYETQPRDDQEAAFNVYFELKANYLLFAAGASYVQVPASVNTALQSAEGVAPLSLVFVRAEVEKAMRRIFLVKYREAQAASLLALQNSLTTKSTPSAASGSSASIVPMAAAAGGAIIVIIVIIVIVVVLRKKSADGARSKSTAPNARAVVAFENPMYSSKAELMAPTTSANPSDGLYDEPTFTKESDKANPVFQSDPDLAADKSGAAFAMYANDDDVKPDDVAFSAVTQALRTAAFVQPQDDGLEEIHMSDPLVDDFVPEAFVDNGAEDGGYLDVDGMN